MTEKNRTMESVLRAMAFVAIGLILLTGLAGAFSNPLDVPFKTQVPPGTWSATKNCGQTSSLMAYSFYEETTPTEQGIKDIDDWLFQKYGNSQAINGYSGSVTSTTILETLAKEYGGFSGSYRASGWTIARVKQEIDAGHLVIVVVYGEPLGQSYGWHFLVAKGYTATGIITNDPGRINGVITYGNTQFSNAMSGAVVVVLDKDTWNFNIPNNAEGWKAEDHNTEGYSVNSNVNSGSFFVDPKQTDPYIRSAKISLDAGNYNAIEMNMASNCEDGNARIYFTTTSSQGYSESKMVEFKVNNNGGWQTYLVYMANNELWKGTISGLRIDFAGSGKSGIDETDTVGFDWIKVVDTPKNPLLVCWDLEYYSDFNRIDFEYHIKNPFANDIEDVRLGAQIRTVNPLSDWINDYSGDKVVTLKSGTLEDSKEYGRSFQISPYASYGTYDAHWVILNHKTGAWYDNVERHSAFMIEAPPPAVIVDPTPTPTPTPTPDPDLNPGPAPDPDPDPDPTPDPVPDPDPTPDPEPEPEPTPELKPDLIIAEAQIIDGTFYSSTKNIGDVQSESSWTGFYVGSSFKTRMATDCLNPGETKRIGFNLSVLGVKNGDEIKSLADYQNVIDEMNETNNDLTIVFVEPEPEPTPTPEPDLTPTPEPESSPTPEPTSEPAPTPEPDLTPTPELKPDLTVVDIQVVDDCFCGSVQNIGDGDAELVRVLLEVNGFYELAVQVNWIGSDTTRNAWFPVPHDIENGDEIRMFADHRNVIEETDETNNDLTIIFVEPEPTPTPTPEPTPDPNAAIYVPDDYSTIQWAVNEADAGDTIIVRTGTYVESIEIDKQLTLIGEGEVVIQSAPNKDHVFDITADYTNISGFDINGASIGIYLHQSDNSRLEDMKVSGATYGIFLRCSDNCVIGNNTIRENGYGIYLLNSAGNVVANNTVVNNASGISCYGLSDNKILNNRIGNSTIRGIRLYDSLSASVMGNTISDNERGIYLSLSENCNIFHNNFFRNAENVYDSSNGNLENFWDNGTEGNYWDDYTGVDANSDGIGDTPYVVFTGSKDNYPLMESWED